MLPFVANGKRPLERARQTAPRRPRCVLITVCRAQGALLNMTTASVYKWVIDDVVAKAKPEVLQEGLDESVLDELRARWEQKLMQKGLLEGDAPPAAANAAPMEQSVPMLQHNVHNPMLAAAIQAALAAQRAAAANAPLAAVGIKREQPDNGFDALQRRGPNVPQQDGPADDGDEEEDEAAGAEEADGNEQEGAGDEVLSSDSDEEDDEEDATCEHFLCCQFEKVSRTKNKWKIVMKDGVFHINGKDYLFKKAQGEWIF